MVRGFMELNIYVPPISLFQFVVQSDYTVNHML